MIFVSIFSYRRTGVPSPVFHLDKKVIDLENTERWSHLGHMFVCDLSDRDDIAKRRNGFVRQVNNWLCQFSALDSLTLNKLFNHFCCSFYGCGL